MTWRWISIWKVYREQPLLLPDWDIGFDMVVKVDALVWNLKLAVSKGASLWRRSLPYN